MSKAGELTYNEMVRACANVGIDLTCGTCAAVFYTGIGAGEHTCSAKDVISFTVHKETNIDGLSVKPGDEVTLRVEGGVLVGSSCAYAPLPPVEETET